MTIVAVWWDIFFPALCFFALIIPGGIATWRDHPQARGIMGLCIVWPLVFALGAGVWAGIQILCYGYSAYIHIIQYQPHPIANFLFVGGMMGGYLALLVWSFWKVKS